MRAIEEVATEALSRHPLKLLSVIGRGPYSELTRIFITALTTERRNAATSMRSACVEKVKAKEIALREIAEGAEKAGNMIWSKSALTQAECAKQIWQELESVPIQEQEASR